MRFTRSSGVLLHLTSLPGQFGIGDLGAAAYRFIDFLAESKQSLWQILPLGPTSRGNNYSPYVALSAFAGSPLLISLETLVEDGLLPASALAEVPTLPEGEADYDQALLHKLPLLRMASERFAGLTADPWSTVFAAFCHQHHWWLDDYALFMALREVFYEASWDSWEPELVHREPSALRDWGVRLAQDILFHKYLQFFFFTQWARLKTYANQHGIQIIGDLPIYVGFDSAEVWSHSELFSLDPHTRTPLAVAGVPPDAFSETGQRWGNPLYRWRDEHGQPVEAVHEWWVRRFRSTLELTDILRIDHFRGFEAYWSVPVTEETALNGQWIAGPGANLFTRVQDALGDLPVIAEDLGMITPEVDALRLRFGFPGMKVLQFAFDGNATNPYLPHNYTDPRCVVYTGTHDNDTTLGWFRSSPPERRMAILHYLGRANSPELHWDMIRLALSSVAGMAVVPLQDILGLGSTGRMNTPGQSQGNWCWRYQPGALHSALSARLAELTHTYGRDKG
ncbi:MAG TPA: 4-alpha-glucanotransferase [Candidatus Binatia bacterium]|jgi:4-alpha-glucanotransferase|nr:4-alpha-glucanotransferase [Candidatus Binatia bacterium]